MKTKVNRIVFGLTFIWVVIFGLATFASAQNNDIIPRRDFKRSKPVATPAPTATAQLAALPVAKVTPAPDTSTVWILIFIGVVGVIVFLVSNMMSSFRKKRADRKIEKEEEAMAAAEKLEEDLKPFFPPQNKKDKSGSDSGTSGSGTSGSGIVGYVIFFALGLSSVSAHAGAAEKCVPVSITGGVVTKQRKEPAEIVFHVQNCGHQVVASIQAGGPHITFSEVMSSPARVTAKVQASADAPTGGIAFMFVLADGSEVESPNSVFFTVRGPELEDVRQEMIARMQSNQSERLTAPNKTQNDRRVTTQRLTSPKNDLKAANLRLDSLDAKIDVLATNAITKEQIQAVATITLEEVNARIAKVLDSSVKNNPALDEIKGQVKWLTEVVARLNHNVHSLASTEVGSGFFGRKKPLNNDLANKIEADRASLMAKKKAIDGNLDLDEIR